MPMDDQNHQKYEYQWAIRITKNPNTTGLSESTENPNTTYSTIKINVNEIPLALRITENPNSNGYDFSINGLRRGSYF